MLFMKEANQPYVRKGRKEDVQKDDRETPSLLFPDRMRRLDACESKLLEILRVSQGFVWFMSC